MGDWTQHDYRSSYRVRYISFRTDFFKITELLPAHNAAKFANFLPQNNVTTFYHPPPPSYSPDLSPPNHFLFPKLKMKLKGLYFADVVEIQEAVTDELKKVQKRGIFGSFLMCIRFLKNQS